MRRLGVGVAQAAAGRPRVGWWRGGGGGGPPRRSAQARTPVSGEEPNAPALTLPFIVSPLTVTANSRVMGNGEVMDADHVNASPSTLPEISCSPMRPFILPAKVSPLLAILSSPSCTPIGELMAVFPD